MFVCVMCALCGVGRECVSTLRDAKWKEALNKERGLSLTLEKSKQCFVWRFLPRV